MPLDRDKLYDRIDYLRQINRDSIIDRSRIRDIMNGGEAAVKALLGGSMMLSITNYLHLIYF